MIQPWHWFIICIIAIIIEIYTQAFIGVLWFGIAAFIMCLIVLLFPEAFYNWQGQTLAWLCMSAFSAICWFYFLAPKRSKKKIKKLLDSNALIGEIATIVAPPINTDTGNIRAGTLRFNVPKAGINDWEFYNATEEMHELRMGTRVRVVGNIDTMLIVTKID